MPQYMNLTVVEVKSPNCILARETPGPTASKETEAYGRLFQEINAYFSDDFMTFENYYPKNNEICVALNVKSGKWHRVRVQQMLSALRGAKADCFFLDTGENQMIQIQKIRRIPEKYLAVPFQVKTFVLDGLQPMSLTMNSDLNAVQRPCKLWDVSATVLLKNLVQEASVIQAVVNSKGKSNLYYSTIYLKFPNSSTTISVNDYLVEQKYALPKNNASDNQSDIKRKLLREMAAKEPFEKVGNNGSCDNTLPANFEEDNHPVPYLNSLLPCPSNIDISTLFHRRRGSDSDYTTRTSDWQCSSNPAQQSSTGFSQQHNYSSRNPGNDIQFQATCSSGLIPLVCHKPKELPSFESQPSPFETFLAAHKEIHSSTKNIPSTKNQPSRKSYSDCDTAEEMTFNNSHSSNKPARSNGFKQQAKDLSQSLSSHCLSSQKELSLGAGNTATKTEKVASEGAQQKSCILSELLASHRRASKLAEKNMSSKLDTQSACRQVNKPQISTTTTTTITTTTNSATRTTNCQQVLDKLASKNVPPLYQESTKVSSDNSLSNGKASQLAGKDMSSKQATHSASQQVNKPQISTTVTSSRATNTINCQQIPDKLASKNVPSLNQESTKVSSDNSLSNGKASQLAGKDMSSKQGTHSASQQVNKPQISTTVTPSRATNTINCQQIPDKLASKNVPSLNQEPTKVSSDNSLSNGKASQLAGKDMSSKQGTHSASQQVNKPQISTTVTPSRATNTINCQQIPDKLASKNVPSLNQEPTKVSRSDNGLNKEASDVLKSFLAYHTQLISSANSSSWLHTSSDISAKDPRLNAKSHSESSDNDQRGEGFTSNSTHENNQRKGRLISDSGSSGSERGGGGGRGVLSATRSQNSVRLLGKDNSPVEDKTTSVREHVSSGCNTPALSDKHNCTSPAPPPPKPPPSSSPIDKHLDGCLKKGNWSRTSEWQSLTELKATSEQLPSYIRYPDGLVKNETKLSEDEAEEVAVTELGAEDSTVTTESTVKERVIESVRGKAETKLSEDEAEEVAVTELGAEDSTVTTESTVKERVIESVRGKALLWELGAPRRVLEPQDFHPLSTESILLSDSVLFVAEKIPNPIYDLQAYDVPNAITHLLTELPDMKQPKSIQAYSWRPAIRGKDIVGISPKDSGKTWAYLIPIFSNLCQYTMYSDIKFNNGPFALILVSSWTKATVVYEQCKKMTLSHRDIMVEVIYGGGAETKKTVNLLNGCHILVATLPCLNRMLEAKFTNLERLCHLVIDDADIMLEDFYDEIKSLMQLYKRTAQIRDQANQRNQIMVFSQKWTKYIQAFVKNGMEDNVVIITDMIEAAVYGCIKQVPMMCTESERQSKMVSLLPDLMKDGEKVIVFTTKDQDCTNLQHLLTTRTGSQVEMATNSSFMSQRKKISQEWKLPLSKDQPYRFLVCADTALCNLEISDATCVVHYNLPTLKTHLGLRMQSMSNYFHHYNDKVPAKRFGKSYFLLTNEDKKKIKSISALLQRSGELNNQETLNFLSTIQKEHDLDPSKQLCSSIKAFGKCRTWLECNERHRVLPEIDLNGNNKEHIVLPTQGEVRIKVLHMNSANNFYGRILEHRNGKQKTVKIHSSLGSMILGMATYYSDHTNWNTLDKLEVGTFCAVNTCEQFSRVKVLKLFDNAAKNMAKLFFVDIGKTESHAVYNLYQLPDEFYHIPYQAVEMFLCRVHPVDYDIQWSQIANSFSKSWVASKMLYGKIRFVMKNTLWLDPLLERSFLKGINSVTNGTSLRKELLDHKLAIDNPQHLPLLHKVFEGNIPDVEPCIKLQSSLSSWENELNPESLSEEDKCQTVSISHIFSPENFYVHKVGMEICLNDLMVKIQDKIKKEVESQQKRDWVKGIHCLCKSSSDSRWYRVYIVKVMENEAVVQFVDYGNIETISLAGLRTISREMMYLPAQAINCQLAHVKPAKGQWAEWGSVLFNQLSRTVVKEKKNLTVNVVSVMATNSGNGQKYCVELLDTSFQKVSNLAQELVWWKCAVSEDNYFVPLFTKPLFSSQVFFPSADKIVDMFAILYYEEDRDSRKQCIDMLQNYMDVCLETPKQLVIKGVPESFLRLLQFTDDPTTFCRLVGFVHQFISEPRLYSNLLSMGLFFTLARILEMSKDEVIIDSILQLIPSLPKFSAILMDQKTSQNQGLDLFLIVCKLLKSSHTVKVKTTICCLLESLCKCGLSICHHLLKSKMCPHLIPEVLHTNDHCLTEAYLSLFPQIMQLDSGLIELKREGPVQEIVKIIKQEKCEKCVHICLTVCQELSDKSRKNKTQLLELGIVPLLTSCKPSLKNLSTAQLCQELLDGLTVKIAPSLDVRDFPNKVYPERTINTNLPDVYWCQNKFRLIITFKLGKAEESSVQFDKTVVHFSFTRNNKCDTLSYELYNEVVVSKCIARYQQKETLLSLTKAEVDNWPRLLHTDQKPTNLFVDFERFEDDEDTGSENEEMEADEDNPFTLQVKLKVTPLPKDLMENIPPLDVDNSDDDSLEDYDFHEHDRFDIYNTKY